MNVYLLSVKTRARFSISRKGVAKVQHDFFRPYGTHAKRQHTFSISKRSPVKRFASCSD